MVSLLALLTQIYLIIGAGLIARGPMHADLSLSDKAEEFSLSLKEKHAYILPSIFSMTLL